MRHLASEYPVRWLCRLLGCGRAGLYRAPTEPADEAALRKAVERLSLAWPTYGYRRLTALLLRRAYSNAWRITGRRLAAASSRRRTGVV